MSQPKLGKTVKGLPLHYSVGALIKKDGKYLMIDRVKPPFGFAGIAGHIDEGESPEQSLVREVQEEGGLKVVNFKLLAEEELDWNTCSKGVGCHYWYLYECEVEGELKREVKEVKFIGWYSLEELKRLKLEPAWEYWFKKLGLIPSLL